MLVHGLILAPVAGFALAAAVGVVIRARRAREDKHGRESFTINM
jgi:hypothetical protein